MDKEKIKTFLNGIFDDMSGAMTAGMVYVGFRPIGCLVLKGKREGVCVFEPINQQENPSSKIQAYREAYDFEARTPK